MAIYNYTVSFSLACRPYRCEIWMYVEICFNNGIYYYGKKIHHSLSNFNLLYFKKIPRTSWFSSQPWMPGDHIRSHPPCLEPTHLRRWFQHLLVHGGETGSGCPHLGQGHQLKEHPSHRHQPSFRYPVSVQGHCLQHVWSQRTLWSNCCHLHKM